MIHVVVPKQRRQQAGFRLHTCRNLDPRDITTFNGVPAGQLADVIYEAAFRNRFHLGLTLEAMDRARGRKLSVLRKALAMYAAGSAGTRSWLEDRFLRLVRGAGLPEPVINAPFLGLEVDFRRLGPATAFRTRHSRLAAS